MEGLYEELYINEIEGASVNSKARALLGFFTLILHITLLSEYLFEAIAVDRRLFFISALALHLFDR